MASLPAETTKLSFLYVFLDEAGDFDFSVNGSKYFVITAGTIARPFPWDDKLARLKYDLIERGLPIEYFHASGDRQEVRDRVFKVIESEISNLRLDSLVVEKRKTAPLLQEPQRFYPEMMKYLLQYVLKGLKSDEYAGIVIVTDRIPLHKKRDAVEKALKHEVKAMLPSTRYVVLHHASMSCPSLQAVDYCNWAIFRKWRDDDMRSYSIIQSAIRSEFDIFKVGQTYYY